ncbi:hypothetical protein EJ02DRAFT_164873 [Clathrospora elynae]|uniref:Uncharacterized protein n=1 Tax=Clathrospora elynae TaxID=706981 RepID=A0A6A5SQX4_9PLEO|nr:hypothetical protein EJ02DRAFT_164873 [Clathrospora elynae]
MYSHYTFLSILTLLARTFAAPHDEDAPQNSTTLSTPPKTGKLTKTVVVTVTHTSYTTDQPPPSNSPHDHASYTPAFATPPPPDSVPSYTYSNQEPGLSVPTNTAPTLIYPHPTEPCMIDGISIWPSRTTSLVLPELSYGPLPTSMVSGPSYTNTTLSTSTVANSGSPTDGPSVSMGMSTTCPHSMSHIVPGKSTSLPTSGSSTTFGTSEAESSILPVDPSHPPSLAPEPTQPPSIRTPVKARDIESSLSNLSMLNPTTPAWKTIIWTGLSSTHSHTQIRRAEGSKNHKRRKIFWSRFFAAAASPSSPNDCRPCDPNTLNTCLPNNQYEFCIQNCVVSRDLGPGMTCNNDTTWRGGQPCMPCEHEGAVFCWGKDGYGVCEGGCAVFQKLEMGNCKEGRGLGRAVMLGF